MFKKIVQRVKLYVLNKFVDSLLFRTNGVMGNGKKYALLTPHVIVSLILWKVYQFNLSKLRIYSVIVDTEDPDRVEITVFLARPGLLIGRGGSLISKVEDLLSEQFSLPIQVDVREVKFDKNEPFDYDCK